MPSTFKTPGVYIEEISKFPPSVAQVETAIPAFIGYTQKAEVRGKDYHKLMEEPDTAPDAGGATPDAGGATTGTADPVKAAPVKALTGNPVPIRITSLLEYEQFFGKAEPESDSLTATVTAFGEVSAAIGEPSPHNMYYSLQAYFANGGGPAYIVSVGKTAPQAQAAAIQAGRLNAGLEAIEKEDEITLIVFPESLSLSTADSKGLYDAALAQCNKLQDRFVVMDAELDAPNTSIFDAAQSFRSDGISNDNLKYGAAYGPRIQTIFDYRYDPSGVKLTLPAMKDENGQKVIDLNGEPVKDKTLADIDPAVASDYGQFFPLIESAIAALPVVLPAAPLVVGAYANTDSTRGVWKAPANVSLKSVIGPTLKISNAEQENLNLDTTGKSINAIRAFTGKGTLIWGARTLAGNDNEWRYVPVRRFFNMAEESIKKATEQFVFEPNDANTWIKVKAMIENFLILQWRAGALAGAKPEQSFYVKIGLNETMTALDILEGRMIVEIGMAVVRPAEFIILKFSHKMQES